MCIDAMTPEELRRAGWEALVDRLGPVDAARFLQLYDPGTGNYTLERRAWLDNLTLEEIFEAMERARRGK